jgi:uncharacterized protein
MLSEDVRMAHTNPTDDELRKLLSSARTIALVGASSNPDRPAHGVMKFLLRRGFHVIPVSPGESDVLGQQAHPALSAITEPVDIVDVFRRAEATPGIADEAVSIGARALWLQLGIVSEEAARRATSGGLTVVMDRCIAEATRDLDVAKPGA